MPSVSALYHEHLSHGLLERDLAQEAVIERLQFLQERVYSYAAAKKRSQSFFYRFFSKKPKVPRGLYIWGNVGRGKTMLLDLFFQTTQIVAKRRLHFHEFMTEVHARIHAWREAKKCGEVRGTEPISAVARDLAREAWLFMFDECVVNDITDAMILGRLCDALWREGVVILTTSNVPPSHLYEGGLNRALFLPFITQLEAQIDVIRLEARLDYRLQGFVQEPTWHIVDSSQIGHIAMDRAFALFSGHKTAPPAELFVMGRKLILPQAINGVARARFHDLCEQPLGPADYVEIARQFHILILEEVPVILSHQRNELRRFIWLVDALYNQNVKLYISAHAPLEQIYEREKGDGRESFEFQRTFSRLTEMQSQTYLTSPHGTGPRLGSAHEIIT